MRDELLLVELLQVEVPPRLRLRQWLRQWLRQRLRLCGPRLRSSRSVVRGPGPRLCGPRADLCGPGPHLCGSCPDLRCRPHVRLPCRCS